MFDLTAFSFLVAALAFSVLTGLLLTVRIAGERGALLLILACIVSTVWCAAMAFQSWSVYSLRPLLEVLEILRGASWVAFLSYVRGFRIVRKPRARLAGRYATSLMLTGFGALVVAAMAVPYLDGITAYEAPRRPLVLLLGMLLSIVALALAEQIYRTTPLAQRTAIGFLCLGMGALFAYDLTAYLSALFFVHASGWGGVSHGVFNVIVVPLIAVAAARNAHWGVNVFVSREAAFYGISVLGIGMAGLLAGSLGYYLSLAAGGGATAAVLGFASSAMAVLVLGISRRFRAYLKVFLSKHFYRSKYDYRKAWLHFTHILSTDLQGMELQQNIIRAIGALVDSPGGIMWMRQDGGWFEPVAQWAISLSGDVSEETGSPLIRFLEESRWVIYLDEYRRLPQRYAGLELPLWLQRLRQAWLIAPLWQGDELIGYIVLLRGERDREFNFEDSDLLKTVGRQAASYLALIGTTQALTQARQFEAFNRLASFVVHDLKNLVAQLSLVVSNAQIHRHNPVFMEDAIETVAAATAKMNRLLAQLRKGRLAESALERVALTPVARKVIELRSVYRPVPIFEDEQQDLLVEANPDRLAAVVEHLVQNAQEATPVDGQVSVRLYREGHCAVLEVLDTGAGMTPQFVSERLFRPFDTTKGNAGMGMGMYESREYVRAFGGHIKVESMLGHGTLIRVRLPLASSESDPPLPVSGASLQ